MRLAGKPYESMGIVHPSIANKALRDYAGDYLRRSK